MGLTARTANLRWLSSMRAFCSARRENMGARFRISTTRTGTKNLLFRQVFSDYHPLLLQTPRSQLTVVLNQPECAAACSVSSPVRMAAAAAVISNMGEPLRASSGQVILTEALCPKQCRYLYQFDSACSSAFFRRLCQGVCVGQLTEKASTRRRHGLKTIKGAFCGASTTAYGCRPAGPRKRWTSWHSACPRLLSASCRA